MQAQRVARELALLSISQLPANPEKIINQKLQDLVLASIRTLAAEARDTLETAAAELQRGNDKLLKSETRAGSVQVARSMVQDAIDQTQTAINRLGGAIELPEFIQLANQTEVRAYAMEIITRLQVERKTVDKFLNEILIDWQMDRLAVIDRDILRIAVTEMMFLGKPSGIAINEAVELAKRYSGEEGYKFINGVLRRVAEQLSATHQSS